ncbi:hypothetical protein B0H16DRAFT_1313841 [Mycena metata]|uniref:Uncharacterized protein n=1 Tax=Mycena metata TaxID=1033252 RepID=A0AAD7NFI8_9AGAR|nr:hypothetical protein B0H16DRAFT_1313841 [Mycena metata]
MNAETGECPTCKVAFGALGDGETSALRHLENILEALDTLGEGGTVYAKACAAVGIKPVVHPFWEHLPYTNIFTFITPDILHQLYQGIIKHLIAWIKETYGEAEIDARCRRLPPNHNVRVFMKGISKLNRVTGKEHDQISRFLLGIIIDLPLPGDLSPVRLVRAVRAVLDFVYIAQYPLQSTETIAHLANARERFHENKGIFVDLGVRDDFNLPKLHSWDHYPLNITYYGTLDNCNTENTERLHIDLAKDAYRATNSKDEFPQMTLWLERKEKILRHEQYIQSRLKGCPGPPIVENLYPGVVYERKLVMAKHPTHKAVKFNTIKTEYGAKFFPEALSRYVAELSDPTLTPAQIEATSTSVSLLFNSVSVFQRIKFSTSDPHGKDGPEDTIVDAIHVQPHQYLANGNEVPARFDTALVILGDRGRTEVHGKLSDAYLSLPGSFHVISRRVQSCASSPCLHPPPRVVKTTFPPGIEPPKYLAYVEWFSRFTKEPERNHLMFKLTRTETRGERMASIIPVQNIRRSIHLTPKFGPVVPPHWKSSTVLEECKVFFATPWTDRHIYPTLF